MKRRAASLVTAAFLCGASAAWAQSPARGFDSFRLVKMRNVFDPDRRAGRVANQARTQPATAGADYVALTGTLVTPEKSLAFFNGSLPEYNKVLTVGESVAGATILSITPATVELQRAEKKIAVAVGQQLPADDNAHPSEAAVPNDAATPAPPEPSPTPLPPAPADASSDLVRRMMERRQKEITP
jgi:hypothetical protein